MISKNRDSFFYHIFNSRLAKNQLLFILFFSSVITLIGTAIQVFVEFKDDIEYLDIQLQQIERSHLESLTSSLWTLDNNQINIQLNNILSLRDIVYLEIMDKGETIVSAGNYPDKNARKKTYPMIHIRKGKPIEIGQLHAWASLTGVYQRMTRRLVIILVTQGLKTFVVSMFILFILYQKVIRHLIELSNYTKDMTIEGLDQSFTLNRKKSNLPDELDSLIEMFNDMRKRLSIDIEMMKKKDTAFRESKQQLEAALQANPDPFVLYNSMGHPLYLNPAFQDIFGWTLDDLKGKRIPFVPEDQKEITASKIEDLFRIGRPVRFISQRLTCNNDLVDVIISSAIVRDAKGNASGMVTNLTDISDQKKLERQLRQAQKMESVGRLAGGVAHDFNNMLSIIIGNMEMVLEDIDPSSPLTAYLKEIQKAALRSADLTRQLLAFARKQTISPVIIDLNEVIDGMLKMLHRLIGEGIDLLWKPAAQIWAVKIDTTQIDQILANLCVNAKDAITDVGKITIETDNVSFDQNYCQEHPEFKPGDYVLVTFSDNGHGMDKDVMEKIFDPFFTTKELGKGTGLGLATIYGIVKQNKGFIHVFSEVNHGTVFKIYFPRHHSQGVDKLKKKSDDSLFGGHETILLVEDELPILNITRDLLERMGYHVMTATGPAEAIEISRRLRENEVELLITDVVMPKMNGRDLAEQVSQRHSNLECLFMSGYSADVIAHHGILDEGINFINKPFSKKELLEKIRRVLEKNKDNK